MHELSIAQNIIEIVKENVPETELPGVKTVFLEIGDMSGVVSDSLQFCFDAIKPETPFPQAVMQIKKIPFVLFCNDCRTETTNSYGIRECTKCGGFNTEIISGNEMRITEVELNS